MKICAIAPGVVHAVSRTVAFADQFDETHFIDVAGKADREKLERRDIIYHGPNHIGKSVINSFQLEHLFKEIDPDAIVCHFASGDHFFAAISYGRCPVVAIAMGHDVLYDEGDSSVPMFRRLLTRMALRRSLFISAKAKGLAKRVASFRVRSPMVVNYWGADLNKFVPGPKSEARKNLGWSVRRPIILSPRAIEPRLNIHLIVEAFRDVLLEQPEALLVILGRSRPDYRKDIERLIKQSNLADRVCMLGEVSQDVLPHFYQASDIAVSMARSDGFPNTLLEVMACKIPIVVGRFSNMEELLEDGSNAWICEIEPRNIASAIVDVLADREKSDRISNVAFETAKEYGDIKKNGLQFSADLKQHIARGNHRPRKRTDLFRALYVLYRIHRKLKAVWKTGHVQKETLSRER